MSTRERVRDAPREVRRALLGTAVLFASNGLAVFAFLARMPEIAARNGLDLVGVGVVLLVGQLGGVVAAPVVPRLLRNLGTRDASVLGSAFLATSVALVGLATAPWQLALALVVVGVGDVLADLPMNAQASLVQDRLPRSVFSRLHGLWSVGALGGSAVAAATVGLGVELVPFLVGVAVVLSVVAVGVRPLLLADGPGRRGSAAQVAVPADRAAVARGVVPGDDVGEPVGDEGVDVVGAALRGAGLRAAVLLGALGFVTAFMEAPPSWGGLLVTEDLAGSEQAGALVVAAFSAAQVVGRLSGDVAIDRLGPVRAMRLSVGAQAVGVALAALGGAPTTVGLGYALLGVGAAIGFPLLYRAAATTDGLASGVGLAAMNLGSRAGFVLGPLLVGAAADRLGVGDGLAVVMGVALVALMFASPRFRAG